MKTTILPIRYLGEKQEKRISAYESYFNKFTVSGIMLFEKQQPIDLDKLISALEKSLEYFNFLFYRSCSENFIKDKYCAIVFKSANTITPLADITSQLTPPPNPNGQIALQFTQGSGEYAIAYTFNHAFLDQSSLLTFFDIITHLYHNQDYTPTHIQLLNPDNALSLKEREIWRNKEYSLNIARQHDRIHKDDYTLTAYQALNKDQKTYPIKLYIPKAKLKQIQIAWSDGQTYISSNDMINALLVYLAAHDKKLRQHGPLECQFAMNVRPALGLGTHNIGNYLTMVTIPNDKLLPFAEDKDLKGIATKIRQQVLQTNPNHFNDLINWYATLNDRQESGDDYISRFRLNPAMIQTTNWTSFDYNTLALDKAKFIGLSQPFSPNVHRLYRCPIMQTTRNNDLYYTCEFTTASDMTDLLQRLNRTVFNNILEF
jgi:hypothetical protein